LYLPVPKSTCNNADGLGLAIFAVDANTGQSFYMQFTNTCVPPIKCIICGIRGAGASHET